MRLTNSDRDAFVKAVMDDVPKIDYQKMGKDIAVKEMVENMPAKVRAVFEDKKLKHYLDAEYVHMPGYLDSFRIYGATDYKMSPETLEKLRQMSDLAEAQAEQHEALKAKVRAVIYGCSTLKAAKERLPEFEKYLPADRDGTGVTNLPAVSNVVADLVKAGWPKGEEK